MNFEEVYNELRAKPLSQTGESVKITNGLFKEEDMINVFASNTELYFCIDKAGMKELVQNVINKVSKINKTNGFERMIDTFYIIQAEIGEYFGKEQQMSRLQYYMVNGKNISEDVYLCSMSDIKGKGIAECAEKASVANNILLFLNKVGLFPYEINYMNSVVEMPNEKGGHAFLSFTKTNSLGNKSQIIYDVTNPEIILLNDNYYNYPAVYSLSEEEYNQFLQGGSFDNSHFVENFPLKDKRIFSGFYIEKNFDGMIDKSEKITPTSSNEELAQVREEMMNTGVPASSNEELAQLRNEMMNETISKPTAKELEKLRDEYIKMMSGDDTDFEVVSDKDSTYSDHMTLPTQSNGMHRR